MCCGCGGGTTGGSDPYGCVSYQTTGTNCFNKFVEKELAAEIKATEGKCSYWTNSRSTNEYIYKVWYGACKDGSWDLSFDATPEQWKQIVFSDTEFMNYKGAAADTTVGGKVRKTFNIKYGARDRVAFQLPVSMSDFSVAKAKSNHK